MWGSVRQLPGCGGEALIIREGGRLGIDGKGGVRGESDFPGVTVSLREGGGVQSGEGFLSRNKRSVHARCQ